MHFQTGRVKNMPSQTYFLGSYQKIDSTKEEKRRWNSRHRVLVYGKDKMWIRGKPMVIALEDAGPGPKPGGRPEEKFH